MTGIPDMTYMWNSYTFRVTPWSSKREEGMAGGDIFKTSYQQPLRGMNTNVLQGQRLQRLNYHGDG